MVANQRQGVKNTVTVTMKTTGTVVPIMRTVVPTTGTVTVNGD
ncbi:MAG TPA: hypothetical protein VNS88_16765 [Nitrospiraceae bacterium]|nr:hypothetical protein [Nitrospiraceae bacterium]